MLLHVETKFEHLFSLVCFILLYVKPEMEFKEFEPRFKSAKTRFKFSAGIFRTNLLNSTSPCMYFMSHET